MNIFKVLFILYLARPGFMSFYSMQQCECGQILNLNDCMSFTSSCQWDSSKQICTEKLVEEQQQQQTQEIVTSRFCSQFSTQIDCLNKENNNGCQWYNSKCSHFIGCTIFEETTDEKCKTYSPNCISNGEYCVNLELYCDSYLQKETCLLTILGTHCQWNEDDKKCTKPDKCNQLPNSLTTDKQCRTEIKTCTTQADGGCVESGITCADQKLEIQCFFDLDQKNTCVWLVDTCYELSCEGAPNIYTTDQQCLDFLSNCTAKENGGCQDRKTCSDAMIEAACTFDQNNQVCYWNGNNCVEKNCKNAPTSFTTDEQCKGFLPTCTPKKDGGCASNNSCGNFEFESLCIKDSYDYDCFWNQTFSECRYKNCENAPSSLTTTEQCQKFYNMKNCLVQANGGCRTTDDCFLTDTQQDCTIDYWGKICYWSEDQHCGYLEQACNRFVEKEQCDNFTQTKCAWMGNCAIRECNLAYGLNTLDQCQQYKSNCMVESNKCVDIPLTCSDNKNYETCVYRGYYVGNEFKKFKCGWTYSGCQDSDTVTCDDILNVNNKNSYCQQFSSDCILSNSYRGCMINPKDCSEKKTSDNCFNNQKYNIICWWDSNNKICKPLTCINTYQYHSYDKETTFWFCSSYFDNCIPNNDLTGCIERPKNCSELSKNNCQDDRPDKKVYCFWQEEKCVEAVCSNIISTTQHDCRTTLTQTFCALNDNKINCQPLKDLCSDYQIQENCQFNNKFQECHWNILTKQCDLGKGDVSVCYQIPRSYLTIQGGCEEYGLMYGQYCETSSYPIYDGCQNKMKYCMDYLQKESCHKTQANQSIDFDDCQWDDDKSYCHPVYNSISAIIVTDVIKSEKDCQNLFGQNFTISFGSLLQCQYKEQSCSSYTTQQTCTFAFEGSCYFNVTCKLADSNTDCSYFNGQYDLCQVFSPTCKKDSQSACIRKVCSDYYPDRGGNWIECHKYLDCSVSFYLKCTVKQNTCNLYTSPDDCIQISQSQFCQWKNNSCQTWDQICESIQIMDSSICEYYSSKCIYNKYFTQCQTQKSLCSEYLVKDNCSKAVEGDCFWKSTTLQCFRPSTDADCSQIQIQNLNLELCQKMNSNCIPNRLNTACQELKSKCSLYTNLNECTQNINKVKCVQTAPLDSQATCTEYDPNQTCETVYLGQGITSSSLCIYSFGCTQKDSNSCQTRTCENATYGAIAYNLCSFWFEECFLNSTKDKCLKKYEKCVDIPAWDLQHNDCKVANEGECMVKSQNYCVRKICELADKIKYNSYENCQTFSTSCIHIQKYTYGCIEVGPCSAQTTQTKCEKNPKYTCHWNSWYENCVNKVCSELEESYHFHSSQQCADFGCILKESLYGCQNKGNCQDYNFDQCQEGAQNTNNQDCGWNFNKNTPVCEIKQCSTATINMMTHQDCYNYSQKCTVQVQNVNNQLNIGGCTPLMQSCSMYLTEQQCQIDQNKQLCGWNGEKCINRLCSTAPKTQDYSSHDNCNQYLNSCTVNQNLVGCQDIPNTCEEIKLSEQCKIKKSGDQCIWLDQGKCILKTCELTNSEYLSNMNFAHEQDCNNFLPECSVVPIKCLQMKCEDFKFTTVAECKNARPGCTTDGTQCIQQGDYCEDQKTQDGCTVDYRGKECAWVAFSNPPYCTNKDCQTAPLSLKTELECQQYFSQDCTNAIDGGCHWKYNQCDSYLKAEYCTFTKKGQQCQWDGKYCNHKVIGCNDFIGNTHLQCKSQLSQCTVGSDGKCVKMVNCSEITQETSCIVGINGPCLWLPFIVNSDKTKGACFQYTSCQSFSWDKDEQCKRISPQCTTDGSKCVSISKCERNNTRGGCVTGTDGECIQLDSQCKKFESCSQAQYSTHEMCQVAHKKCTTDGKNCIELKQLCSDYQNEESCNINKIGQKYENGKVISTGKCVWKSGKCQDQDCDSIYYDTNEKCQNILSSCISNGYQCYSFEQLCKSLSEDDCKNGKLAACIWKDSSCTPMSSCSDASDNQTICEVNKNKCNWIPKIDATQSKCVEHTCDTYFKANTICQKFQNLDGQYQQYCQLDSKGECQSFDPKNFTQVECSIQTDFTFKWDKKCLSCEQIMKIPNNIETSNLYYDINMEISQSGQKLLQIFEVILILMIIMII